MPVPTVVNPVPPLATVTVSDKVDPAAVTVIGADPSKSTPLIALAVARAVAVSAFPVTSPVRLPANKVAVKSPLFELKVKLLPDFAARVAPVAAVTNTGKHVVSVDSSATTKADVDTAKVAESALPVTSPVTSPVIVPTTSKLPPTSKSSAICKSS